MATKTKAPSKLTVAAGAGKAISDELLKNMKDHGFDVSKTTSEADARKILCKHLEENGLDSAQTESDTLNDLWQMAVVFPLGEGTTSAPVEEDPLEEEEVPPVKEKTAKEKPVKAAPAAKAKAKPKVAPKEEEEEVPAEEEEEALVEEVKTKKLKNKPAKKAAPAPAPAKGKGKKAAASRRRKLEGRNWQNLSKDEKEKAIKPLKKFLPEKQFRFEFLQKSFTVKFLGDSSEQNIFKYHLLRLLPTGKLEGCFISHRFKTPDDLEQFLPDLNGRKLLKGDSCAYVHPFTIDEVIDVLGETEFLKLSIERASKQDKKMKINREKLETRLKETKSTSAKKATTKKVAAPAKKAAVKKTAPAKKAVPVKKAAAKKPVTKKKK